MRINRVGSPLRVNTMTVGAIESLGEQTMLALDSGV